MILAFMLATSLTPPPQDTRAPLLIDRDRIDRPRAPLPPAPTDAGAPATAKVAARGSNAAITGVRFQGAKAPPRVAAAARAYLGRRADAVTLQAMAVDLADAYAHSNVALYTVAVPDQNFSGGTVTVLLTEGSIAGGILRAKEGAHPRLRERMAPLLAEKPLSRRRFERQLTLMRAIPGLTVAPDFADASGTGALTMTVTPTQRRSKLSGGFSSRGIDLLGDGQFDARGEFYGVARDGDQITLAASAARDLKRYRYASAAYAVPVTSGGVTLSANAAYLETRPRGSPVTGRAKLAGITLTDPVLRSFHQSADVSVGIDGIDSDNALFGNIVASERIRTVRLAGGFASTRDRTSASLSASLSHGLDGLGARVTAPFAESGFAKASAAIGVAQAIGKRGALRVNAYAQYSRDALPAAERFAIGGEAIGRAFDIGLLTGDRGFGGLAEIAWRPARDARFATSEVYGFVDGGRVALSARDVLPAQRFDLASAGIGGRFRYRQRAEFGLEAAHTLDDPFPGYADDWRVSVSWRISR